MAKQRPGNDPKRMKKRAPRTTYNKHIRIKEGAGEKTKEQPIPKNQNTETGKLKIQPKDSKKNNITDKF